MKRFEFRLARVRDFRRQQLEVEEAKLETLRAERKKLEAESLRLENEASGTRQSLMVIGSVEAQELIAADRYLRHLAEEAKRQAAKMADWQERARQQEEAMVWRGGACTCSRSWRRSSSPCGRRKPIASRRICRRSYIWRAGRENDARCGLRRPEHWRPSQ